MNYMNYGFPQYQQPNVYQQPQRQIQMIKMFPVSNIMEANSTPVDGFEPIFFYNRAENVVYMKQMLQDCSAPIQTFKLQLAQEPKSEVEPAENINPYENDFKGINDRLDGLQKTFDDYIKSQSEVLEVVEDKKGRK